MFCTFRSVCVCVQKKCFKFEATLSPGVSALGSSPLLGLVPGPRPHRTSMLCEQAHNVVHEDAARNRGVERRATRSIVVVGKRAPFVVSEQPHTLRAFALGARMGLSEQPTRAAATLFTNFACG